MDNATTPAAYLATAARYESDAETIDARAAEAERRLPPAIESDPITYPLPGPPEGITLDRLRAESLRAQADKLRYEAQRSVRRWRAARRMAGK